MVKCFPSIIPRSSELKASLIFLFLSTNIALLRFTIDSATEGEDSDGNWKLPELLCSKHNDQHHKFQREASRWCWALGGDTEAKLTSPLMTWIMGQHISSTNSQRCNLEWLIQWMTKVPFRGTSTGWKMSTQECNEIVPNLFWFPSHDINKYSNSFCRKECVQL